MKTLLLVVLFFGSIFSITAFAQSNKFLNKTDINAGFSFADGNNIGRCSRFTGAFLKTNADRDLNLSPYFSVSSFGTSSAAHGSHYNTDQLTRKQRTQVLAGLSTDEAPHLGIRYRMNQTTLGFNVGIVPPFANHQHFASIGSSFGWHLWGTSKKTDLKPWYVNASFAGVSYSLWYTRITNARGKLVYGAIHLGRDFNITSRIATTFSIGPIAQLYAKTHNDTGVKEGFYFYHYPGIDMAIFYRLQKV